MTLRLFFEKKAEQARKRGLAAALTSSAAELHGRLEAKRGRGDVIWSDDWDVCIVLDSLRYDTCYNVKPVAPGRSVASATPEWIARTFSGEHEAAWSGAGYVTSNPFSGREGGTRWTDADAFPLRNRGLAYLDEVWVDEWGAEGVETVDPGVVTERAMWAWQNREKLGIDRLVVHYLQPHLPFRSMPDLFEGWGGASKFGRMDAQKETDAWQLLGDGEVDRGDFMEAYRDNLRWVLPEVDRWYDAVDGAILMTSDHGNAAGERGLYGHPPGIHLEPLVKVPWQKYDGLGKGVDADPEGEPPAVSGSSELEDKLSALGYL